MTSVDLGLKNSITCELRVTFSGRDVSSLKQDNDVTLRYTSGAVIKVTPCYTRDVSYIVLHPWCKSMLHHITHLVQTSVMSLMEVNVA